VITTNYSGKLEGLDFAFRGDMKQINPELISRFRQFLFVGDNSIPILKFIKYLDHRGVKSYEYVGRYKYDTDKKYNLRGSDVVEERLIILAEDGRALGDLIRPRDVIYSVLLQHGLFNDYFDLIFPMLGCVTQSFLQKLGFLFHYKSIKNCVYLNGTFCSTLKNYTMELGKRFLVKDYKFVEFFGKKGNKLGPSVMSETPWMDGWSLLESNTIGRLVYQCGANHFHITTGSEHVHLISFVRDVVIPAHNVLVNVNVVSVRDLPVVFSEVIGDKTITLSETRKIVVSTAMLHDMKSDPRLCYNKEYKLFFNPNSNHTYLWDHDYAILETMIRVNGYDLTFLFQLIFDVVLPKLRLGVGLTLNVHETRPKGPGIIHIYNNLQVSLLDEYALKNSCGRWGGFYGQPQDRSLYCPVYDESLARLLWYSFYVWREEKIKIAWGDEITPKLV